MAKGYVALCALLLLLQAAWTQAAPAEGTELVKPRGSLGLVDEHVVGGDYVDIKDVPYQLSLNVLWMHTCGAAIVSENFALTAAHCNMGVNFLTKYLTWLTAGSTTMFPLNFGGTKHWMENSWSHPKYDSGIANYDVAVIKVQSPFQFSNTIKSLPLPPEGMTESQLDYNANATISGWGATQEGNLGTVWLKKNSVRLVPRETCRKAYADFNEITSAMICAGGFGKGDTCQGDSGGPLAHQGRLIGLVSWGQGCNRDSYPGVYTNLLDPEVRKFIKERSNL